MLAPMIFPETISEAPFVTDNTPETNSGKEVPIPTIKTPMTKGGNLSHLPMLSAELVKKFAEVRSNAKAPIKISKFNTILEVFCEPKVRIRLLILQEISQ